MPDPLQDIAAGKVSPFVNNRGTINAVLDAARDWRRRNLGTLAGETADDPSPPACICWVRNDTGGSLPVLSTVKLGEPVISAVDYPHEVNRTPTYPGTAPGAITDAFAVTLEPAEGGEIVRAVILGQVACDLTVTDEAHGYASPTVGVTATMGSSATGPAKIIWRESGTGTKRAVLLLGSDAVGSEGGYVAQLTTSGASTGGAVGWKHYRLTLDSSDVYVTDGAETSTFDAIPALQLFGVVTRPFPGMRVYMFPSRRAGRTEFIPLVGQTWTGHGLLTAVSSGKWKWKPITLDVSGAEVVGAETSVYSATPIEMWDTSDYPLHDLPAAVGMRVVMTEDLTAHTGDGETQYRFIPCMDYATTGSVMSTALFPPYEEWTYTLETDPDAGDTAPRAGFLLPGKDVGSMQFSSGIRAGASAFYGMCYFSGGFWADQSVFRNQWNYCYGLDDSAVFILNRDGGAAGGFRADSDSYGSTVLRAVFGSGLGTVDFGVANTWSTGPDGAMYPAAAFVKARFYAVTASDGVGPNEMWVGRNKVITIGGTDYVFKGGILVETFNGASYDPEPAVFPDLCGGSTGGDSGGGDGGGGGGGDEITVTALGTDGGIEASGTTVSLLIAGITVPDGCTLVVNLAMWLSGDDPPGTDTVGTDGVDFDGNAMTSYGSSGLGDVDGASLFQFYWTNGGGDVTGDVTCDVDRTGGGNGVAAMMTASYATAIAGTPTVSAGADGVTSNPDSGASGSGGADEYVSASAFYTSQANPGTWQNGFAEVQRVSQSGYTLAEAYLITAASGTSDAKLQFAFTYPNDWGCVLGGLS